MNKKITILSLALLLSTPVLCDESTLDPAAAAALLQVHQSAVQGDDSLTSKKPAFVPMSEEKARDFVQVNILCATANFLLADVLKRKLGKELTESDMFLISQYLDRQVEGLNTATSQEAQDLITAGLKNMDNLVAGFGEFLQQKQDQAQQELERAAAPQTEGADQSALSQSEDGVSAEQQ